MQKNKRAIPGRLLAGVAALMFGSCMAPAAIAQSEPIIFVHGYANDTTVFNTMVSRFVASGYPSARLYRFRYASTINSNRTSAAQLRDFVNSVRAANGNATVSIVGHSNGGLVTRYYRAKLGGAAAIRRFVSLGTPHHGSSWAYGCVSPVCFEMRPYSVFLYDLAGEFGCDRSLWSGSDGLVLPATSAKCGSSTQTASVSHMSLLTDQSVYNQLRDQLR